MIPFPKHKTQTQNKNIKHTAGGDSGSSISIPVRETQRVAPSIEKNQSNSAAKATPLHPNHKNIHPTHYHDTEKGFLKSYATKASRTTTSTPTSLKRPSE